MTGGTAQEPRQSSGPTGQGQVEIALKVTSKKVLCEGHEDLKMTPGDLMELEVGAGNR